MSNSNLESKQLSTTFYGLPSDVLIKISQYLKTPSRALLAVSLRPKRGRNHRPRAQAAQDIVAQTDWDTLDFGMLEPSLASKLTDANIASILSVIDETADHETFWKGNESGSRCGFRSNASSASVSASVSASTSFISWNMIGSGLVAPSRNLVRTLRLTGCTNIIGSGLKPLIKPGILEELDLNISSKDEIRRHFKSPAGGKCFKLQEDVVLLILSKMLPPDMAAVAFSLKIVSFPKLWRVNDASAMFQFLEDFDKALNNRKFRCSSKTCGNLCHDRVPQDLYDDVTEAALSKDDPLYGIHLSVCSFCKGSFCGKMDACEMEGCCLICDASACKDCYKDLAMTECDGCYGLMCLDVCSGPLCSNCHCLYCPQCVISRGCPMCRIPPLVLKLIYLDDGIDY